MLIEANCYMSFYIALHTQSSCRIIIIIIIYHHGSQMDGEYFKRRIISQNLYLIINRMLKLMRTYSTLSFDGRQITGLTVYFFCKEEFVTVLSTRCGFSVNMPNCGKGNFPREIHPFFFHSKKIHNNLIKSSQGFPIFSQHFIIEKYEFFLEKHRIFHPAS